MIFQSSTDTTHNGHAYEIAKTLPLDYDAVVTVSGDGLIHEVMNGFSHHDEPRKAFAIPIAPIPTGSGNGLALNLLGIEVGIIPVLLARYINLDIQEGFRCNGGSTECDQRSAHSGSK